MKHALFVVAICVLAPVGTAFGDGPPANFPSFDVPGHEIEMGQLRDLFWLHYPGAGPKATLWDDWLSGPALWPAVETGDQAKAMQRDWSATLSGRQISPEGYVAKIGRAHV